MKIVHGTARAVLLIAMGIGLVSLSITCGGGTKEVSGPAPQLPAAPAQPAAAAPGVEPQPADRASQQAPAALEPARKPAAERPKYGGTITIAQQFEPASWDPMRLPTGLQTSPASPMYGDGNLVKPCREDVFQICPGIAENWKPNSEFTEWTFTIRDNVFWHDGTPFTGQDVKWWVELAAFGAQSGDKKRLPALAKQNFGSITAVETLPNKQLRIKLSRPSQILPELWSSPYDLIAHPRHLMQPRIEQGEFNVAPNDVGWVATGPFKMVKYEKGVRAQLRRFDKYWEKDNEGRQLPFLDELQYAVIGDATLMDAAFRTGKLDVGVPTSAFSVTRARQSKYIEDLGDKVSFATIPGRPHTFTLNVLKPGPLQDVRVRKALQLSLDRQAGIEAVMDGSGQLYTILNPKSPWPNPDFRTWPGWNPATKDQDRAEAKRLLKEAGYGEGAKLTLVCFRIWIPRCEFLHAQWAKVGIEIVLDLVDAAGYGARRVRLDHDIQSTGLCHPGVYPEACEDQLGRHSLNAASWPKHDDIKVDDFFARLNGATTYDQRLTIYRQLERYFLLEQVYLISAFAHFDVVPYTSRLKGVWIPASNGDYNNDRATVWVANRAA